MEVKARMAVEVRAKVVRIRRATGVRARNTAEGFGRLWGQAPTGLTPVHLVAFHTA